MKTLFLKKCINRNFELSSDYFYSGQLKIQNTFVIVNIETWVLSLRNSYITLKELQNCILHTILVWSLFRLLRDYGGLPILHILHIPQISF